MAACHVHPIRRRPRRERMRQEHLGRTRIQGQERLLRPQPTRRQRAPRQHVDSGQPDARRCTKDHGEVTNVTGTHQTHTSKIRWYWWAISAGFAFTSAIALILWLSATNNPQGKPWLENPTSLVIA